MIEIQPLSRETLATATKLADEVFLYQRWWEKASTAFQLSLIPGYFPKLLLGLVGIKYSEYWVAINSHANVVGITGLYTQYGDGKTCWLGWTCVAPDSRGKKIGSKLVDFAIDRARNSSANYLKLYTSDMPDYAIARKLYERKGFKLIRPVKTKHKQLSFNTLYYQLILR